MDYLLRDSRHIGVAYGRFDHYRLIDTLRILPTPQYGASQTSDSAVGAPALGVEAGGVESAEALVLARYFMYSQVYFHAVRRIYDIHLMDFLKEWLEDEHFSTELSDHLCMTDNEVTAAILKSARDERQRGHSHARRIVEREHFKVIYERNAEDVIVNPDAGRAIFDALCERFKARDFRHDRLHQGTVAHDFPVRRRDGKVVSSLSMSEILNDVPGVSIDFVFADPETVEKARVWLDRNRESVIKLN